MTYKILIIDNEDQQEGIDKINELVKPKSLTVECHQFNVGLPHGGKVINAKGRIDRLLIEKEFHEKFGWQKFHLILFDFNLSDDFFDGVSLIKFFNARTSTKRAKKILFSAELEEIVQDYLNKYKDNGDFDGAWDKFKTLIKLDIVDFCKKEDYESKAVNCLPRIEIRDNDYLIEELGTHPDLKLNNSIRSYKGKTLQEIANLIEKGDSGINKFKRELIQMAVSILTDLDSEK